MRNAQVRLSCPQAMAVGATAAFVVDAVGTVPLRYQWWFNGINQLTNGNQAGGSIISGATNAVLTLGNAQTNNSGGFTVVITNSSGSVTSAVAQLTVTNIPPAIIVQPTNQLVVLTSNVTFVVMATGTAPLSYQWWMDETNLLTDGGQISGAASNVLTITGVETNDSGDYTVIVTNYGGSVTSSIATLTVATSPVIIVQPTNQTVTAGVTTAFTVTAIGIMPLSYQWQVNGTNLMDGGQFDGALSNILTISDVQTANRGVYTVIVTNIAGSTISSNAVLMVGPLNFTSLVAVGDGSFILSGGGGTNNGIYYVLATTNLALPLTNWTPVATDQFDSLGGFIFTNVPATNTPQLFYLLKQP